MNKTDLEKIEIISHQQITKIQFSGGGQFIRVFAVWSNASKIVFRILKYGRIKK